MAELSGDLAVREQQVAALEAVAAQYAATLASREAAAAKSARKNEQALAEKDAQMMKARGDACGDACFTMRFARWSRTTRIFTCMHAIAVGSSTKLLLTSACRSSKTCS